LVFRLQRVKVYVHWSVLLLAAGLVGFAGRQFLEALVAVGSFFGVVLLHEWGHVLAARRHGCRVDAVEIFPFLGRTLHSMPYSRLEEGVVAWSGALLQLAVATPIIALVNRFGFTPWGAVNAVLLFFGYFSAFIAILNLLPVAPLDGVRAWPILPALVRQQWRQMAARRLPRGPDRWRH
jgi:Zn-dependent protease